MQYEQKGLRIFARYQLLFSTSYERNETDLLYCWYINRRTRVDGFDIC